ncbi:MAG: response regulator [Beijerinckiaceae bacterium]|nr:response regulator [Beijerinckiaceae bacterium]
MTSKILVVDDEPDLEHLVIQKFRRAVRDGEIQFVFARDGVEALDMLAAQQDIDLVVSDINMPRMDGLSLLARIQEKEAQLATVIVSAYGDMANIRTAMNRGAFDFLTKPIDLQDFETTIRKTLGHVASFREAQRGRAAAERAHASLSRYFSPNLVARLASDSGLPELAGQRREVASVFTDIAGFTMLVETIDPKILAELLNDYLASMTAVIFAHEGTVTKIVGDAIHVLFGAPGDQPDHADRAVACALDFDDCAQAIRTRWTKRGVELGPTRIGAHAGPAIVGNFGSGSFFDYTAYGDTINTAARLEAANKQLGTRVCVSAYLAERARSFTGRPIGDLVLRGRSEPLRAFEALRAGDGTASTARYSEAFGKLDAGDPGAMPAFAAVVGAHPGDLLAGFHLRRLLNGATSTRIELL